MIKRAFYALKQFLIDYSEHRAKNFKNNRIGY